jgi:formate hydrogenlyase subunit 3/multisubunit Na+/H+ antiporter MnhD subunit
LYYILFNVLLIISILAVFRLLFVGSSASDFSFIQKLSKLFLSVSIFYLFSSLTLINYLFDYYYSYFTLFSRSLQTDSIIMNQHSNKFFELTSNSLFNTEVYVYPFIYVFVLVTTLSIVFCLTYNSDELNTFMFYCTVIIFAGYSLFFTDSIIIFFFSYEMLLVPSFFILYKFAKTRRAVEAAYLMFFWTQFGALFLIICFIYLFFIVGTSSFFNISNFFLSEPEVNFIFVCLIFGFGVKLPIWPFYG